MLENCGVSQTRCCRRELRLQRLEPRLLLSAFGPEATGLAAAGLVADRDGPLPAGVTDIWMERGATELYPGDGVQEYELSCSVHGSELTRLQVTTPWGEVFDSDGILPSGWSGESFWYEDHVLNLDFWAENDGGADNFEVGWEYVTAAEWSDIESNQSDLTVSYTGGTWNGSAGFSSSALPTETPNITNPSHNAGSVALTPTFQWDQWASPGTGAGIWWALSNEATGEDVYEIEDAPANTTSWTPGFSLDPDTEYVLELDFHHQSPELVNGVSAGLYSYTESDIFFTTGTQGTVPELWVERGVDEDYPGDGLSQSEYSLAGQGADLTGLYAITPWGHAWDSDHYLPANWSGEELDGYDSDLRLQWEAGSDGGVRYIELCTVELDSAEWDLLDSEVASVELYYRGGVQSGTVGFGGTTIPTETPNVTYPAHNATDIELTPTFEWDQWASPGTGAGIWWALSNEATGEDVYEIEDAPADTTRWTPATPLEAGAVHEFELDFHHAAATTLGTADVSIVSWREVDIIFTTTGGTAPQLLWGLNNANGIFVRDGITDADPTGTAWLRVPGKLAQISVGEGNVWGINPSGGIFVREGVSDSSLRGTGWTRVSGSLAQVSVGEMGLAWGLNDVGGIFVRTGVTEGQPGGTGWDRVTGKLTQISVGEGSVWGLNANGGVFVRQGVDPATPNGTGWQHVPGTLAHVTVGETGIVWGLNPADGIFVRTGVTEGQPAGTGWQKIPGRLAHVTAGFGSVWGVNANGAIFCREDVSDTDPAGTGWNRCTGALRQVSVGLCNVRTTQSPKDRAVTASTLGALDVAGGSSLPHLHTGFPGETVDWPEWLNWTEGAFS